MDVIQRNKTETIDTIHDLLNCWKFNIKSKYSNLIDLTNIILIVSDRDVDIMLDKLLTVINTFETSLSYD